MWSCWENGGKELNRWTVGTYLKVIRPGDGFAFWISGDDAGLYGTGTVTSTPYITTEFDDYWRSPPKEARVVDLQFDHYMFDGPLTRATLASNPEFAESLIIKTPHRPNPIPLMPEQWQILSVAAGRAGRSARPGRSEIVVTSRALGSFPTEAVTNTPARNGVISYPEARLVRAYQKHLGRELRQAVGRLPSGERLECDAFDAQEEMIIEAKASNSRTDIRMAIGQLLDYRHHIKPGAAIAVLLPDQPSTSVADLLRVLDVKLIYKSGTSFIGPK